MRPAGLSSLLLLKNSGCCEMDNRDFSARSGISQSSSKMLLAGRHDCRGWYDMFWAEMTSVFGMDTTERIHLFLHVNRLDVPKGRCKYKGCFCRTADSSQYFYQTAGSPVAGHTPC